MTFASWGALEHSMQSLLCKDCILCESSKWTDFTNGKLSYKTGRIAIFLLTEAVCCKSRRDSAWDIIPVTACSHYPKLSSWKVAACKVFKGSACLPACQDKKESPQRGRASACHPKECQRSDPNGVVNSDNTIPVAHSYFWMYPLVKIPCIKEKGSIQTSPWYGQFTVCRQILEVIEVIES